ncbi:MAG: discoidin domain-containing protein, partial [Candidatus Sericytochromatia bacterium]
MRHWPPIVCALFIVGGCAGAPTPQAPVPIETAPVAVTPTPAATATPAPARTATPSPSASPTASPSPDQLTEVPEASHGDEPFPSPLAENPIDLKGKTVAAGAGNATARGAIDGNLYTQWSARQEMADNVWWSIDLGSVRSISRIDLMPDANPEVRVLFDVEVSDDYKTWTSAGDG